MANNNPNVPNVKSNLMPPTGAGYTMPVNGAMGSNPMDFNLDLTGVKNNFSVPNGDYKAKCIDVEQGISAAGNPQIIWTFAILDGEHKDQEFKLFTALTPAAMWKVAEVVIALGIGQMGQNVRFTRPDVLNKMCTITVEETEYKGQIRSSIVGVKPV